MKKHFVCATWVLVLILTACKKNIKEDAPLSGRRPVPPMLKQMKWPSLARSTDFEYNPESTLAKSTTTGGTSAIVRSYRYNSNGLDQMSSDASLSLNTFEYENQSHRLIRMNRAIREAGGMRIYQFLEFIYDNNDKVSTIKFFKNNIIGAELISTIAISYDTVTNLPSNMSMTDAQGKLAYIFNITAYSDPVDFNPLYFLEEQITELFPIYNLPGLTHLTKLHKIPKVFEITAVNGSGSYLYYKFDSQLTIDAEKIQKQINKIIDPVTSVQTEIEVLFTY